MVWGARALCSLRPAFLPDGPLPDVRLMTEQCHLSGSNASREKLSYSHGAMSPGRVAVWQNRLRSVRWLQPWLSRQSGENVAVLMARERIIRQ